MNRLDNTSRSQIIAALCEGNSIRAVERMTGISRMTITKLLIEIGAACAEYQDKALVNLPCKRVQCDEIWAFCYAKDKNVPEHRRNEFGVGSIWTWTAIDADTKLVASWTVGTRDSESARIFMGDLASRLSNRIQLTTDGHKAYLEAVDEAFSGDIDYAMLVKIYGESENPERRYSPAKYAGARITPVTGNPDIKHVSTSYVERQNLTMRMHMRRFTRLTNGFSKKLENHIAAISLHFMFYNFVRIHQTLKVTPAMAAGVTGRVWDVSDVVKLLEAKECDFAQLAQQRKANKSAKIGPVLGR